MKRNAKTIIAGMIALAISHTAMADDIKVAVVGAMSGPIAQWGDCLLYTSPSPRD